MRVSELFLNRTRVRDKFIFLAYSLLITSLYQVILLEQVLLDFTSFTFIIALFFQFYLSAFLVLPIKNNWLRIGSYVPIFILNFFFFREIAHALLPLAIRAKPLFDLSLSLVFILTIVGRNVRMYINLVVNLERLNALRLHKLLFSNNEQVKINFGKEGELKVHPNEIVYIRTKEAGDHTKIFGLKRKKTESEIARLVEYDTTAYQNFNEIFQVLAPYPQLKRISQSTIINFQYPYEEKNGSILIESRRFAISPKYKKIIPS